VFEVEVGVDSLEKDLALGTGEDWEGALPGDLYFEMIALKRDDCVGHEMVLLVTRTLISAVSLNPASI
jgi:hypothetical protein